MQRNIQHQFKAVFSIVSITHFFTTNFLLLRENELLQSL